MALETGTFISDLVATNPTGSDPLAFADDHLRLVKSTIKATFPNISGAVTKTHAQINAMGTVAEVLAAVYPVGSIYTNATNSTNPASLLGFGTWVSFGAGRVPVGFDGGDTLFNAAEKIGGSKDAALVSHSHTGSTGGQSAGHSHTFSGSVSGTTNEAGLHSHSTNISGSATGDGNPATTTAGPGTVTTSSAGQHSHSFSASYSGTTSGTSGDHSHDFTTATVGSSATNANVQPYITVYMWKRTA